MDPLSAAVDELGLRGVTYRRIDVSSPWQVRYSASGRGLHLVERGRATLELGRRTWELSRGDLVLLPRGAEHSLRSAKGAPRGESSALACGLFDLVAPDHPMLGSLPDVVHVPDESGRTNPRWEGVLRHLVDELGEERPGKSAIVAHLSSIVFVEAVRAHVEASTECPRGGYFRGLQDPSIGKALAAFHARPGDPWSLESLAREAGKSRSAFALRFHELMGEGVMAYVRRWRMFRARTWLREGKLGLEEIAASLGYGSAAAFSVAFTRDHGESPGRFRSGARGLSERSEAPRARRPRPSPLRS